MTYLKIDHVDKTFLRGSQETEFRSDITAEVNKGDYVSITPCARRPTCPLAPGPFASC